MASFRSIKSRIYFSIIELMTVIVIILLLMSLLIAPFNQIKMKSRTAVCASGLRQIGILVNSYASDNNGFLPNDEAAMRHADGVKCFYPEDGKFHIPGDIPFVGGNKNNELYQNWNGHLLPYYDLKLKDGYTRVAMVTKVCTRYSADQLGKSANPAPDDVLQNGFAVIDDAYQKGGFNDLKSFICPEMHSNHIDVTTALKFNGIRIPRVSQLITNGHNPWSAFQDAAGWGYGLGGGTPSSYQANEIFFGYGIFNNSKRIDQITDIADKAMILEGKGATTGLYYRVGSTQYDGGDLSASASFNPPSWEETDPGLSFVHDSIDEFWVIKNVTYDWTIGSGFANDLAERFNSHYAGSAYMVTGSNTSSGFLGSSIVSFSYPVDNGSNYKDFLKQFCPSINLANVKAYVDQPNEYRYLVGNMNVLFGDGSVRCKSQSWLFNNRLKVGFSN